MPGPKINEERRPLIEPADFHLPTTASLPKHRMSPPTVTAIKSPLKDRSITPPRASAHQREPVLQQADRNTFEESFAAALSRPHITYDGQYDNDEYGDQTPLLNACYNNNDPHLPTRRQPTTPNPYQPSRHAPLEPASKSKASCSICLWNEVSHNSQYTRPVAGILREVLEIRYPAIAHASHQSIAAGEQVGSDRRRWWRRVTTRLQRHERRHG